MIRRLLEWTTSGIVFRRTLPHERGGAVLHVSTAAAGLNFL
ncbi:MAG: hypothetical protein O3A51_02850 [Verrucomicrobia bacterium]|nr:hypothetical protein [Verrucomicrobiota bacterium]